jgi:hypothetical protein
VGYPTERIKEEWRRDHIVIETEALAGDGGGGGGGGDGDGPLTAFEFGATNDRATIYRERVWNVK